MAEDESVGIAAALRVVRDGVIVDRLMAGGPAYISGKLKEGCLITAIDGAKVTSHFHSNEISDMLRGPEGTRISLQVINPDQSGYHNRTKIEYVDLVLSYTPPHLDPDSFCAATLAHLSGHAVL